jgi:hypothetical protein
MGIEPTYAGLTIRCSANEPQSPLKLRPYVRKGLDRNRTCVSGFADQRLTTRPRDQKHAVKGLNLPTPDLEAGVPPLGLTAY